MYQILRRFVVCSTLCVFLTPGEFYTQANEGVSRLSLGRDHAYDGVASVNTQYYVKNLQETNFVTCARNCLLHSHDCAALLYSETLLYCSLLKCHLNDKLVINNTEGDDWEYWRNSQACEEGWVPFAGHCYFFNETKSTWDDAAEFCDRQGGYLIEMNSPEENSWVVDYSLLPETGAEEECPLFWSCSIWIGAIYHSSSGEFVWNHGGGEMTIPEWNENQPNNASGNQECVILMRSGTANDMPRSYTFQFLCEKD
ncbi:C-type lectin domain family 4 member G-like [Ostrea edulis]|uniref:C-type lectin domain family 4 member G-like n=1 Tax=Ostrea edulis TaxID=37623 RepID=UPI0024AF3059|nr:C-type lectin domain family 4 member G-like [Ostrea edulis]